jgi:hypothetical protein
MSTIRHTPGPWFTGALRIGGADPTKDGCDIGAANGSNVAIVLHQASDRDPHETLANVRCIVHCVNSYDTMVEALKLIATGACFANANIAIAREALAKVGEELAAGSV